MPSVAPTYGTAPLMEHTPDPAATSQAQTVDGAAADRSARSRLRDQVAENPLLSLIAGLTLALFTLLGTVALALLLFVLNNFSDRFDRLEARMEAGFAAQDARISELDARLTAQISELDRRLTARIDELDARLTARIDELDRRLTAQIAALDRKLTALVAHLNATEAVEAAVEHRLLIPGAGASEPRGEPSG